MTTTRTNAIRRDHEPAIGILCLDEEKPDSWVAGGLSDPRTFSWKVLCKRVEGATVQATLSADPQLAKAYSTAARDLERQGASVIISNCGYTVVYNNEVREQVTAPVALSSLQLLPLLDRLKRSRQKIAILTFDAGKLTWDHLKAAWPAIREEAVVVGGMENTKSWHQVYRDGRYDWSQLQADSLSVLQRLVENNRDIAYVVVECAALCSFLPTYRTQSGIAVFDIITLAHHLMEAIDLGERRNNVEPPKQISDPIWAF